MQQQGGEVVEAKPGKFSMELCQVPSKIQKVEYSLAREACVQSACVKVEREQDITQRLKGDLDLTQREVSSLKTEVLRLKAEQKENEQVIQQLQQANKALYQRLDELQSRCDCMEDQSRRLKDSAVSSGGLWYSQDLDKSSSNLQSLRDIHSKLLLCPLKDFCILFGKKYGVSLYDAVHGSAHTYFTDTWNRDHPEAVPFPIDLSKRHFQENDSDFDFARSHSPPIDLSTQTNHTLGNETDWIDDHPCGPVDLSIKPMKSMYEDEVCLQRSSPEAHFDGGQDSGSNSSDLPPLRIDLGNTSDDGEVLRQERCEPMHDTEMKNEEDMENLSFISAVNDEELPEPSLTKISSYRRRKRGPKSWEFLMRLMADKRTNPSVIRWEDREAATIRLIQPHYIAQLWGKRSSKPNLTYDHFARALRYHYKKGQLIKVSERQLVYGCGPQALRFLELLLQQNQSTGELEEDALLWNEVSDAQVPQDHTYYNKKRN
ncbi:uncharacterized protein LOC122242089 [Penaeus japonicus]|uniref:uncharacterized protein LOC122242089 n=1 Tax=Penaeus japonicus TaxID=27405 RepID=UPI001C710059|nr:uncharacterized protein LOC122242089 [Penaeus japonicus]